MFFLYLNNIFYTPKIKNATFIFFTKNNENVSIIYEKTINKCLFMF